MFNKDFQFGVATSSYQIEGTKINGTNIESIWDAFCRKENTIDDNSDGAVACEHINRYKQDVQIIKDLGVDVYRFSVSWARIVPQEGIVSQEGLDFYKALLQELKDNGIKASITLYHWDMPQWIYEKNGGWISRDTAYLFLEYAKVVIAELDEYVCDWVTLNEPFCAAFLGYAIGVHAPGHKNVEETFKAIHYLNLAHGLVASYYKENYSKPIGLVVNVAPSYPVDDTYSSKLAAKMSDDNIVGVFLGPVFNRSYPMHILAVAGSEVENYDFILSEDMEIISTDIDFLGVNYYTCGPAKYNKYSPLLFEGVPTGKKQTAMGWDVDAQGLYDAIKGIRDEYTSIPIIITENGSAWDDELVDNEVEDNDRVEYLEQHLETVVNMNNDGLNVVGYYAWSLMDNFEWAYGYTKRFGIVYVDYETQKRYPKKSYKRYKEIIKTKQL